MPATAEKPAEISAIALIDPVLEVRGEIVTSNIDLIVGQIREVLPQINLSPATDEEFGQAEADVKSIKSVEDALKASRTAALKQAEGIQSVLDELDGVNEELREKRLELAGCIKKEKRRRKEELINEGLGLIEHRKAPTFRERLVKSAKGKRSFAAMEKAIAHEVNIINAGIEATAAVIARYVKTHGQAIAHDEDDLAARPASEVEVEMKRRAERIASEAERQRLKDEAEKAKAAAKAAEQSSPQPGNGAQGEPVTGQGSGVSGEIAPDPVCPPHETDPAGVVNPADLTAEEEMRAFFSLLRDQMGPVKAAREALRYGENIQRAARFAEHFAAGVKALTEKGGAE